MLNEKSRRLGAFCFVATEKCRFRSLNDVSDPTKGGTYRPQTVGAHPFGRLRTGPSGTLSFDRLRIRPSARPVVA